MDYINGENISIILFFIGMYGLIGRRNIVKSIISISIIQAAIILYFISAGTPSGSAPPIYPINNGEIVSDPLPQALMITDIVIGVGVTAGSLTMFIHIYHRYGTANWLKVKKKREK